MLPRFRVVPLRARDPACCTCGESPSVTAATIPSFDYARFTGQAFHDAAGPPVQLLGESERIGPDELRQAGPWRKDTSGGCPAPFSSLPRFCALPRFCVPHSAWALAPRYPRSCVRINGEPSEQRFLWHVQLLGARMRPQVLDVRPKQQWDLARLPGCMHQPFDQLAGALDREPTLGLDPGAPTVVLCRRGNDSQHASRLLQSKGFLNVRDLRGGLDAWRDTVDPGFPRY